jgi:hypothetical protein
VFDNPIRERRLKTDVATGFLRLKPLVLQNLITLGLKLSIKRGVLQEIVPHVVMSCFQKAWFGCSSGMREYYTP